MQPFFLASMAISNSSKSVVTTSTPHLNSYPNFSFWRRPSVRAVVDNSNAVEAKNLGKNESLDDRDSAGAGDDRVEPRNNGIYSGEKMVNGENWVIDVALKFAYRPLVPAHRRVKESLLSSDAIFKQVFFQLKVETTLVDFLVDFHIAVCK